MTDYSALAAQFGGKPAEAAPDEGMARTGATMRRIAAGVNPLGEYVPEAAYGAKQALDALAQMAARGTGLGTADTERAVQSTREDYNRAFGPSAPPGAELAIGAGQGVATGPLAPAMRGAGVLGSLVKGGAAGAAGGVLTPIYDEPLEGGDFWGKKAGQAGMGAAVGGPLSAGVSVLGKIASPTIDAAQKLMHAAGVRMTPGQVVGGVAKTVEDKLMSVPLIGDLIRSRRVESITDFNRAVYSNALKSFGDEGAAIAKSAPVGRQGVAAVGDFLDGKYNEALARSVPSKVDDDFHRAMVQLSTMVAKSDREDFIDVIKREVVDKITPGGTLTPSVAKGAISELNRLAREYKKSETASERELADKFRQAASEVRQLTARHNPEVAPLMKAADEGWANLVQMERAAGYVGARDGIFTPAQFLRAVKESDPRVRGRGFSRGEARNQEFAEAAKNVLPSEVPNSGTVDRMLLGGGALGAAGNFLSPELAIATGAGSIPYLPGVSPAITRMFMANRPRSLVTLGELTKAGAPYLAAPAGALAANQ